MARANGKVILTGEHAVVYGLPALVCGVDLGMSATAEQAGQFALAFDGRDADSNSEPVTAFRALCEALEAEPCRVDVRPAMPTGVGLGASAAMAVAVARAIFEAGLVAPKSPAASEEQRILRAADAWERVFHGSPSGIDAACALAGGCLRFQKDRPSRPIALARSLPLLVAVAGPPSSTKRMVEAVAELRRRNQVAFEGTLRAIGDVVERAEQCLVEGDLTGLGEVLDENQRLLASWLVSTPEIDACCDLAREAGALGAKLTGAGGGGCVIALPGASGREPIITAWSAAGYRCFESIVAAS